MGEFVTAAADRSKGEIDIKSFIGRKSPVRLYEATAERLKAFSAAVGARDRGEAPPTFMTVLLPGMFALLDDIGIPLSSVLHTDQEYIYHSPIQAGDSLSYQTGLTKAFEKQSRTGLMRFMVFETEVHTRRASHELLHVGSCKTTIITRD